MRVAVVGSGAIGSPLVIQLLAESDIEEIRVIDPDRVELSNLPRQPWFTPSDIGKFKAQVIRDYEPGRIHGIVESVTKHNVPELFQGVDLVFDGSDNWAAREAIQQWAFVSLRPWIFSSALRLDGMSAFLAPQFSCLSCLFGNLQQGPRCFEAGVMGTVTLAVAGQAMVLFHQYRDHQNEPESWPQGLFLIDGREERVRRIGMSTVRCGHGVG